MQAAIAILVRDKVNEFFVWTITSVSFWHHDISNRGAPKGWDNPLCIYIYPGIKAAGNQSMMSKPQ